MKLGTCVVGTKVEVEFKDGCGTKSVSTQGHIQYTCGIVAVVITSEMDSC